MDCCLLGWIKAKIKKYFPNTKKDNSIILGSSQTVDKLDQNRV